MTLIEELAAIELGDWTPDVESVFRYARASMNKPRYRVELEWRADADGCAYIHRTIRRLGL